MRRQISVPSMSGSIRSSSTTSGAKRCDLGQRRAPVLAVSTLNPPASRLYVEELGQIGLVLDDQHPAFGGCSSHSAPQYV